MLLTNYRMGIVIGAFLALGVYAVVEGIEVLVFGGLYYEWTPLRAVLAIGIGLANIGLAVMVHRWWQASLVMVDAIVERGDP